MPSRKKGLSRSTEESGRSRSSKNDGEKNCKNSSVQGAAMFPLPIASNTSVHDLILPDADLVNSVQILALYLLHRACSNDTDFSVILANWFGLGSNRVNIFLAKWFQKQHTAELQRGSVEGEGDAKNELSASISLLENQLICDCARNQQDFCALFADKALCAQVLDKNGNVRTNGIGLVETASQQEENSLETNTFLRGLLKTLQTKNSTVCPQTETPSAVDSLKTLILQRETSLSQTILENTNSIDDIANSEPWKFASRNGCFQPQSSEYWEFFSPGSRWNLCQRRDPLMMQIVETMWSRISKESLTDLVPKIAPSKLQEMLINPAISQLQVIYKEFFTTKQVQIQGIRLSQRLMRELEIRRLSETLTRSWYELQQIQSFEKKLRQSIEQQKKTTQQEKFPPETVSIETTTKEMILIQAEQNKLKNLQDKLANVTQEFQLQKKKYDTRKGELQKLKAQSNFDSVDAEMVQKFCYMFFFTSVMLGRILEYVREYSVRNPPTVYNDITFMIYCTEPQVLFAGYIIPVAVKLHFSDIFMNDLSLVSTDNERIISKYKSDEKSTYFTVRVEYKSDKTSVSTKIEDIKNAKKIQFQPFNYNGKIYKCVKKLDQSVEYMTGPFQEYPYDPVKFLHKANSEQDAAS
jgi:hypothetical protein